LSKTNADADTISAVGNWFPPPRYARPTFLLTTSLYWICLYLYVPILAPYAEYQGGSLALVGLVVSAYGLAQLLLRIPVGLFSDRLGRRKPFLALGFTASIVACIWFVYAPTPWSMVGARFVSGISACAWVAFTVLFSSYFPSSHTTRAMGYITFCNTLSVMGATFLGGQIAESFGWLAPFWASAGVGVLGLLSLNAIYERPSDKSSTQPSIGRLLSVLKFPELILASIVAALGQYTTFATIFGFVPNYAVSIGATKAQLGILSMVGMLTSSLAILVSSSYIVPRLGPRVTVFLSFFAITLGTFVLPFIQSVTILYASQVLAGMGRGASYPILMGLAIARLPDGDKATAMGFFQATYAIGMFAGPVCAGLIGSRWGYPELFLSTAFVSLLTAFVSLCLPPKGKQSS
tara:strand:+ start:5416 stop:6633 length:1218 start_codon:yes stop_codon:yes gene_type:complete